jgi:hypothetical protein
MIDSKTLVRATLTGAGAVTALVPASRIFVQWPTSFQTLPVISYKESTNYNIDENYADGVPVMDQIEIQIDIWTAPGTSPTAIAQAVDNAMKAKLWNREYAEDFTEPDTLLNHKVMRYSNRLYN